MSLKASECQLEVSNKVNKEENHSTAVNLEPSLQVSLRQFVRKWQIGKPSQHLLASTTETLVKTVKHVHSRRWKHQNNVNDSFLVFINYEKKLKFFFKPYAVWFDRERLINFEHISHLFLVFILLTLNK